MRFRNRFQVVARAATALVFLPAFASGAASAQTGDALGAPYRLGGLVEDGNGDGVADRLRARIVLSDAPDAGELAAAAGIAARLGLETMALDLPLRSDAPVAVAVGDGALARLGLAPDAPPPAAGTGEVLFLEGGDGVVLAVRGGDAAGLRAAAGWLAGRAPRLFGPDGATLPEVGRAVVAALPASLAAEATPTTTRVEVSAGAAHLAAVEIRVNVSDGAAARAAVEAVEAAAASLRFDDLALLTVVAAHPGGGERAEVAGEPTPRAPGPVPARPADGLGRDASLGGLYEPGGLLGDANGDRIPDRLDVMIAATAEDPGGVLALAARLGLESGGMDFPVAATPEEAGDEDADLPPLVLAGSSGIHPGIPGRDDLGDDDGLVEIRRSEDGADPALVITGGGTAGYSRALGQVAVAFPHLDERGADRPTVGGVEDAAWRFLSRRTPAAQAAAALYRIERIGAELAGTDIVETSILVSIEDPAPGFAAVVAETAARAGLASPEVVLDDRNVRNAATLFDEEWEIPSEVEAFRRLMVGNVLPAVREGASASVRALLSEPAEVRRRLEREVEGELRARGASVAPGAVRIGSAFRQGYGWIEEEVLPRLLALRDAGTPPAGVRLRFRKHVPPPDWPQAAMLTPLRFQHSMFPADEVLAEALALDLGDIRYEMEEDQDAPTFRVVAEDAGGGTILDERFEPRLVSRPFLDRYPDYERVRVATGWITARVGDRVVVDERIRTDAEAFWDRFQSDALGRLYDHVMERHEGRPRGVADAPYFGELRVDLSLSEPERRLGVEQEIESTHDAVHEDIYFTTLTFMRLIGRNAMGAELTYPGRVLPWMHPKTDGTPGTARVRLTGFATSRPAVVARYVTASGETGEIRRNIPKVEVERPAAVAARVRAGEPGLRSLTLRVKVDADADERASNVIRFGEDPSDERILSAEEAIRMIGLLSDLRAVGMYENALAFRGLGAIELRAGWTWDEDRERERVAVLPPNGAPPPRPDIRAFRDRTGDADRLVQWDAPIPPPEAFGILARMDGFPEATAYRVGESYLGTPIWAMDLMPVIEASHFGRKKASLLKPTIVYTARQHANEVSSTSHVLRLAEMLLTEDEHREKLNRVNVVIHPITNPDGAQLAYDMHQINPEHILHAGYWASLGMDPTSDSGQPMPIYPEAEARPRLWRMWLPDIVLNPHGYPAHQLVQLFSEFSGLVRGGRRTERNWGFNKGWFMPGFDVVDDPELPRHRDEALKIRGYITAAITGTGPVAQMNERTYGRYRRYGIDLDPKVFRMDLHDGVNIQMPVKGRRVRGPGAGGGGGFSYDPKITIWSGGTEAPDEPARGDWMRLVASAGLAWDLAILQYLLDGEHEVKRNSAEFFGGVSIRLDRPRPPEPPGEESPEEG